MLTKTETITVKHELYTFEELDQQAQWHVVDECTRWNLAEDMRVMLEEELDCYFPSSTIEAQWDFSACQGSGLNVYGQFSLNDLVHYAYGYWLDSEEATDVVVNIPPNRGYTYSLWSQLKYWGIVEEALYSYFEEHEEERATNPKHCKMADDITDRVNDLCYRLFDLGAEIVDNYGTPEYNECNLFDASGNYMGQVWDFTEADGWTEATA